MKNLSLKIKLPKALIESKLLKGRTHLLKPIGICIGVVIVLMVLESYFGILNTTFYGQEIIDSKIFKLQALQKDVMFEQRAYREMAQRKSLFISQSNQYWIAQRDGDINLTFQQKLSSAAQKTNINLTNAGSVQVTNVGRNLNTGDLNISCSGDLKGITNFIYALTYSTPKMHWDRLALRPDNTNNKGTIYMNCDVKFMIVSDPGIIKLLGIAAKQ